MPKRKYHPNLIALAEKSGAKRKDGSRDWYQLAQWLAETFCAELVAGPPPNRRAGRRPKNRESIIGAVNRVVCANNLCSVTDACRILAGGDDRKTKELRDEYNQARRNFTNRQAAELLKDCGVPRSQWPEILERAFQKRKRA